MSTGRSRSSTTRPVGSHRPNGRPLRNAPTACAAGSGTAGTGSTEGVTDMNEQQPPSPAVKVASRFDSWKAYYRKGLVAGVGAVTELLSLGVLHGTAREWATAILAVVTAAGVTAVPNGPKPAPAEPPKAA